MLKHTKSIFAIVAALGLSATASQAADVVPGSSAYDWSGFYFGLNAGVALNNSEVNIDMEDLDLFDQSLTGEDAVFTSGASIGYNWQIDSFVFGVEADINYIGFSGDNREDYNDISAVQFATRRVSFDSEWFGTLRGRLGYAADNFLIYGTGGLAYGHAEAESDFRYYYNNAEMGRWSNSADDVNWGWTVGAGVEYGIDKWSLGVEYLYVDLGSSDWDAGYQGTLYFSSTNSEVSNDYQFSLVRATAKLRF